MYILFAMMFLFLHAPTGSVNNSYSYLFSNLSQNFVTWTHLVTKDFHYMGENWKFGAFMLVVVAESVDGTRR